MNLVIIFLAQYLIYLLAAMAVVSGWVAKTSRAGFFWWLVKLLVTLVLGYLAAAVLGYLVPETRPFVTEGFQPLLTQANNQSFPSDHATIAGVLAVVTWRLEKKWGLVAAVLAVLVGVGRVAAGVHYWWDIAAGLVLGVVIALVIIRLWPRRSA